MRGLCSKLQNKDICCDSGDFVVDKIFKWLNEICATLKSTMLERAWPSDCFWCDLMTSYDAVARSVFSHLIIKKIIVGTL